MVDAAAVFTAAMSKVATSLQLPRQTLPEPLEGTPNSNGFWLAALFGLLESMLASGTPGKSPVFSKTDP